MNKKLMRLLLALFCLSSLGVLAQKIDLELKNFPVEIKERKFFIAKVIDSRNDTSKLGWSILNNDTRGKFYTLKRGTAASIQQYLNHNLKPSTDQKPLVMNIVSLLITEKKKAMRYGKVEIVVQFLSEKENNVGVVFQTSASTESNSEIAKDIYSTHERRIRLVINQCLKNLNEYNWEQKIPDYISLEELKQDSKVLDTLSKALADTSNLFGNKRKKKGDIITLDTITYKKGFLLPTLLSKGKKHHTLWAFHKEFRSLNDTRVNTLFTNYKGKFRLSILIFGIGAGLLALSFTDDTNEGMPNLGLLVPGATFVACSIPIYFKSKRLAKETAGQYNRALENK